MPAPSPVTSSQRIALVTGASRGLGRAMAIRLAKDGFLVIVHYGNSKSAADEVVSEITRGGGQAFAVQAEMSSVPSIRAMFDRIGDELEKRTRQRGFDVLINNAGTAIGKAFAQYTEEEFDKQFDLNVKGVFFTTQFALPMLRDNGRIINIGSGLTRFSAPMYAAYSATKGALNVLTQHWAMDLGARGITVNTLAPGAIDTDLNAAWIRTEEGRKQIENAAALKRVGMPEDIADVASFLASSDSRWVTGQRLEAAGGVHV